VKRVWFNARRRLTPMQRRPVNERFDYSRCLRPAPLISAVKQTTYDDALAERQECPYRIKEVLWSLFNES
jgi:hypothetical protein